MGGSQAPPDQTVEHRGAIRSDVFFFVSLAPRLLSYANGLYHPAMPITPSHCNSTAKRWSATTATRHHFHAVDIELGWLRWLCSVTCHGLLTCAAVSRLRCLLSDTVTCCA